MPVDAKIMKRFPISLLLMVLATLFSALGPMAQASLFESSIQALSRIEMFKTDEILLLAIVLLMGVSIDQTRNYMRQRRKRAADKDRIQAVRCTMATVHDVVNNALNNLVLIRLEAEKSQALCPDTLISFDNLIGDTAAKLRQIDELETIAERTLGAGMKTLNIAKHHSTLI